DKAILGSGRALLHGRALANLEAMTVTVGARQQGRPLAVATEIPRFEALAVIRPRGRHHLGRVAGHEHVAAHARRGALHRHIRNVLQDLIVVHGFVPPFRGAPTGSRRRWDREKANAMPRDHHEKSGVSGRARRRSSLYTCNVYHAQSRPSDAGWGIFASSAKSRPAQPKMLCARTGVRMRAMRERRSEASAVRTWCSALATSSTS